MLPGPWRYGLAAEGIVDRDGAPVILFRHHADPSRHVVDHVLRWDPSTVLRLVERDRRDLADICQALDGDREVHVQAFWLAGRALKRMAAFWLGTQDGGS